MLATGVGKGLKSRENKAGERHRQPALEEVDDSAPVEFSIELYGCFIFSF